MNPELAAPCQTTTNTGMAWSVLADVNTLLDRLARTGETSAVDLRGLPMTTADLEQLETLLGQGEVRCALELMGRTDIWETAYSGVWWVRHRGAEDKVASETLVIAPVPDILPAATEDIAGAVRRLDDQLRAGPAPLEPRAEETEHG